MEKCRSLPQYGKFERETAAEEEDNPKTTYDYSSSKSYNFNGPRNYSNGSSSISASGFSTMNDPERKRKKRVASYNIFTVEGKLKSSVKSSFKWVKNKFVVQTDMQQKL